MRLNLATSNPEDRQVLSDHMEENFGQKLYLVPDVSSHSKQFIQPDVFSNGFGSAPESRNNQDGVGYGCGTKRGDGYIHESNPHYGGMGLLKYIPRGDGVTLPAALEFQRYYNEHGQTRKKRRRRVT